MKTVQQVAAEIRNSEKINRISLWPEWYDRNEIQKEIDRQSTIAKNRLRARSKLVDDMFRPPDPLSDGTALFRREWLAKKIRQHNNALASATQWQEQNSDGVYKFGVYLIEIQQSNYFDWDRYSESWNPKPGPVRTRRRNEIRISWVSNNSLLTYEITVSRTTGIRKAIVAAIKELKNA